MLPCLFLSHTCHSLQPASLSTTTSTDYRQLSQDTYLRNRRVREVPMLGKVARDLGKSRDNRFLYQRPEKLKMDSSQYLKPTRKFETTRPRTTGWVSGVSPELQATLARSASVQDKQPRHARGNLCLKTFFNPGSSSLSKSDNGEAHGALTWLKAVCDVWILTLTGIACAEKFFAHARPGAGAPSIYYPSKVRSTY